VPTEDDLEFYRSLVGDQTKETQPEAGSSTGGNAVPPATTAKPVGGGGRPCGPSAMMDGLEFYLGPSGCYSPMAGYHQHPFPAYATAPPPAYGLVPYGQLHTLKYQALWTEGRSQHLRQQQRGGGGGLGAHSAPDPSPSAGGAGGSKAGGGGGGGGGGDLRHSPCN